MIDTEIIQLYFDRDEAAIQETERSYGLRLGALAQGILDCREDAQECVNDTYWRTWDNIPPQKPLSLYAFLACICRRLSLDRLDWNRAKRRGGLVVELTQEMGQCIPDERVLRQSEGAEIRRALESFLDRLPKESRLIFLRRYLYGETVKDIAGHYGISESKVKTQLHRTREKLRKYLHREGISL